MAKVLTTKFKDINKVCAEGCQFAADSNSAVIGMFTIALESYPAGCGENPAPTKDCLLIVDPFYGQVWIGETVDSWAILIGTGAGSPNAEITTEFTIDGSTHPATDTLTDADLFNITINEVQVDNVPATLSTLIYTSGGGVGSIQFPGALGLASVVKVIYHKN